MCVCVCSRLSQPQQLCELVSPLNNQLFYCFNTIVTVPKYIIIIKSVFLLDHDWKPYIRYVTEDLEKNPDPLAVVEREKAMRVKIKEIIGCDVMSDNLVENRQTPLFDVIHANLCLEAVCQSLDEYVETVKKLKQMLKPGGYLLCIGSKGSSWYTCSGSGHKFYVLSMTEKELEECYEKAGILYC